MVYSRDGAPLLDWKHGPPRQSRAADSVALGSVLDEPTLVLPLPGAPEPLNGDCGCGCKGAGTCGKAMGDIASMITPTNLLMVGAAYLVFRHFKKKR